MDFSDVFDLEDVLEIWRLDTFRSWKGEQMYYSGATTHPSSPFRFWIKFAGVELALGGSVTNGGYPI